MNLSDVWIPLVTLTVLQATAVGPAASAQYDKALLNFLMWLRSRGVWRVQTMAGVGLCLARFFDELSMSMAPYAIGEKTMAACGHRTPSIPGPPNTKCPSASRPIKGWKKLHPCRTRGRRQMALGVMLAFCEYLLPSELSGLKAEQVVEPQEFGGRISGTLRSFSTTSGHWSRARQ